MGNSWEIHGKFRTHGIDIHKVLNCGVSGFSNLCFMSRNNAMSTTDLQGDLLKKSTSDDRKNSHGSVFFIVIHYDVKKYMLNPYIHIYIYIYILYCIYV